MKHILFFLLPLSLLFLTSCTGRKEAQYREALSEARRQNLAYEPVTGDSLLRCAVDYFDRHGSANDRLLSRYLLGCAYRDLHEAPLALITWEDAVACADTLSPDCDYATLFRVYGQMAEIYFRQYMPEKEFVAMQHYSKYALLAGDTLNHIRGLLFFNDIYVARGDTSAVFRNIYTVRRMYLQHGMRKEAAQVYPDAIDICVETHQYGKAHAMMEIYEQESGLFDSLGNIASGRERYYYIKGMYYWGLQQTDSAELQFRRLLSVEENALDAYRGLLNLYNRQGNTDSVTKYATLYEDALSKYLTHTKTDAIVQAEGMYNYHRQQQKAQAKERQSRQRGIALQWTLTVAGMMSVLAFLYYRTERKKKTKQELALITLTADYDQALKTLGKTRTEINLLQQSLMRKEATETLLKEKTEQTMQLEKLIADLQNQISHSPDIVLHRNIEESKIMKLFHEISRPHLEQHGSGKTRTDARPATSREWEELEEMIRICHPQFYLFIKRHKLSPLKYKVCILSRYGFDNPQMAVLIGTNKGSIPNARGMLARDLFGLESAYDLDEHLCAIS